MSSPEPTPLLASFADKVPPAREAFVLDADPTNPYASPSVFVTTSQTYDKPPGKGLLWVLFSFDGRIPRRVYWGANLCMLAIFYAIVFVVAFAVHGVDPGNTERGSDLGAVIMLLCYIPMAWISLALQVKRWHDRDKSGWWVLINLIPYIGGIWAFVEVGCLRGTYGRNQFGPDPT